MNGYSAITSGNPVYADVSGQVAATGTVYVGTALQSPTAAGDVFEVLRGPNTNVAGAITGTTATTFDIATGSGKPRAALTSQSGGTGNFRALVQAPATLTADRTYTFVGDASDSIVGAAATQTLTNKSVSGPTVVVNTANAGGLGYATGSGGAVSQLTNRATGVTLNTSTGAITTQATSLAAGGTVSFTLTNSAIAVGDVILASIRSGPTLNTNTYCVVTAVAAGSCVLTLINPSASTADIGAAIINFAVIKAVSA